MRKKTARPRETLRSLKQANLHSIKVLVGVIDAKDTYMADYSDKGKMSPETGKKSIKPYSQLFPLCDSACQIIDHCKSMMYYLSKTLKLVSLNIPRFCFECIF